MTNTLGLNLGLSPVVWNVDEAIKQKRIGSLFAKVPQTFPNTFSSKFPRNPFSHRFLRNSANSEKTISSFSKFGLSLAVRGPVFHGHEESNRSVQKAQRRFEQRSSSVGGQLRRCGDRNGEYFALSFESLFVYSS